MLALCGCTHIHPLLLVVVLHIEATVRAILYIAPDLPVASYGVLFFGTSIINNSAHFYIREHSKNLELIYHNGEMLAAAFVDKIAKIPA